VPAEGRLEGYTTKLGSQAASNAQRDDVLVYATAPLTEDVEVTGPVTLELWASSSVEDTDFVGKLLDVFPDGTAVPLAEGVVRTTYALVHPPVTEKPYRYRIDLWATSNLFKAGHRIRVDVTSSAFPLYELNPNTGARITHDPRHETVTARQRIHHDHAHPSRLILPVIPPDR
jgi:putative CocE/NonD family hydrolase